MTLLKAASLGSGAAVMAAWAATAPVAPPAADPPQARETRVAIVPAALDAQVFEMEREATRLRARINVSVELREPERNPFEFRARRVTPDPAPPRATREAVVMPVVPVAPINPFTLVGMAERETPDGPVRTAIVSGQGQLFLVGVGDAVTTRYVVRAISADVVELVDDASGESIRLALRP